MFHSGRLEIIPAEHLFSLCRGSRVLPIEDDVFADGVRAQDTPRLVTEGALAAEIAPREGHQTRNFRDIAYQLRKPFVVAVPATKAFRELTLSSHSNIKAINMVVVTMDNNTFILTGVNGVSRVVEIDLDSFGVDPTERRQVGSALR